MGRLSCDPMSASSLAPRFMPPCSTRRARPPPPQPPPGLGLGARPISSLDTPTSRAPPSPRRHRRRSRLRACRRRICRPRAPSNPRGAAGRSPPGTARRAARWAGANRQGGGGGEGRAGWGGTPDETRKGSEARRRDEMKGNGSGGGTGVRAPLSKPIAEGTQPAAVVAPPDAAGSEIRDTWTARMRQARVRRGYKAVSSPRWAWLVLWVTRHEHARTPEAGRQRQRVRIPPLLRCCPARDFGIPGLGGLGDSRGGIREGSGKD